MAHSHEQANSGAIPVTAPVVGFEGVSNFRDFGGARTSAGRRVATGRLYRGGSLHLMTESDRLVLAGLRITTLIDLRSDSERRQLPCVWDSAVTVAAPLADDHVVIDIIQRFKAGTVTSEELEDWWNLTRVFQAPEEQVASMRTIFRALMDALPGQAVLIHCRGGKDRTGAVAAFVLDALGVRREDIMTDFLRTNDSGPSEHAVREMAVFQDRLRSLSPGAIAAMQGVRAEWLDQLLTTVADRYGSVAGYLADHVGIGREGIDQLRDNYLERS